MGYGEFGGNGSVEWKVDVEHADWTTDAKKNGGVGPGHRQAGCDRDGKAGDDFTIGIEVPRKEKNDPGKYLNELKDALKYNPQTQRVWFTLKIEEDNTNQIRIDW